jgi:hypothetical protein
MRSRITSSVSGAAFGIQARLVGIVASEQHLFHGLHREGARNLARSVAAHAVGHEEQACIEVDEEAVLVPFADGPGVGSSVTFELHGTQWNPRDDRMRS